MTGKKMLLFIFAATIGLSATAQQKKKEEKCTGECCKGKKDKTNPAIKSAVAMETTIKEKEIACKLTSPELQKRKEEVLAAIKNKIQQTEELPNGYRYLFVGSDSITDQLVAFIKSEKQCCDFFDFALSFSEDQTWLSITGPEGTKSFIKKELDL